MSMLFKPTSHARFDRFLTTGAYDPALGYINDVMVKDRLTDVNSKPYKGRIIPVKTKTPETFLNKCFQDERIREFFDIQSNPGKQNNFSKKLYYVYSNDKQEIFETEIPISNLALTDNQKVQYSALITRRESLIARRAPQADIDDVQNRIERFLSRPVSSGQGAETDYQIFRLDNISIEYNGTNPSTARNDVNVSIRFILESFQALESIVATTPDVTIRLKDLVTLPVAGPQDGGPGFMLKNQYSPNYCRLRLKVKPSIIAPTEGGGETYDFNDTNLIVDLTTIDHKISRKADDGEITFEINYRGYFESVMSMPFNDALADEQILVQRKQRSELINRIMNQPGCNAATVRQVLRIERAAFEAESTTKRYSSIVKRLLDSGYVYDGDLDYDKFKSNNFDITKNNVVTNIVKSSSTFYEGREQAATDLAEGDIKDQPNYFEGFGYGLVDGTYLAIDRYLDKLNFFYLGDLMEVISDCIYEPDMKDGSAVMRDDVKHLNLRFLVAPISLPNPNDLSQPINISPLQIPVSVPFFAAWFHDTVVAKELNYYSIGLFIRDLIERLVNDVLYEACIAHLLPNEFPPILRVSYFESTTANHDLEVISNSRVKNYFRDFDLSAGGNPIPAPFFKRNVDFSVPTRKLESSSYCVIYMQSPPYYRELKANKKTLKDDPYVPTIVSGIYARSVSPIQNVSFSKTDSPYLREARYFNNSYGTLSLLSSVYDLSFKLVGKHGNFYLYPGQVINFILKDFADTNTYNGFNSQGDYQWVAGNANDPHTSKTNANVLGFGGYYIIKSVKYDLPLAPAGWTITINAKFLGTDADQDVREVGDVVKLISEDDQSCRDIYNEIAERYYSTSLQGDNDEESKKRRSQFPQIAEAENQNQNQSNPQATRVASTNAGATTANSQASVAPAPQAVAAPSQLLITNGFENPDAPNYDMLLSVENVQLLCRQALAGNSFAKIEEGGESITINFVLTSGYDPASGDTLKTLDFTSISTPRRSYRGLDLPRKRITNVAFDSEGNNPDGFLEETE